MEFHMSQFDIIGTSMVIAGYWTMIQYLIWTLLPKKVASKRAEIPLRIIQIEELINELKLEKRAMIKLFEKHGEALEKRSFRLHHFMPGIERTIKECENFLNHSADYYAGKYFVALLRLRKLDHKIGILQAEIHSVRLYKGIFMKFVVNRQ